MVEVGGDTSAVSDTKGESLSPSPAKKQSKSIRFWGIFASMCLLSFTCALDVSIITTALPTITDEIGGASQYIWIANSFVVASTVLQLLVGQLADILGRRTPFVTSVLLFALGSGIAGGAYNPGMLIAGRTVQGVGAGGMYVLLDIVCADLVPLRERGKYLGLMFAWAGIGAAIGPVVGGALAQTNWRWIFYMNLPISGAALAILLIFMQMKAGTKDSGLDWRAKFWKVDYLGNLIFIPSMIAILLGLVMGGIEYPWSSWRIIVPIVLGCVGWIVFHIQQTFTSVPSVPTRLFNNRTSAAVYFLTFLLSVLMQTTMYFLPIYFQATLATTVLQSGVNFLPYAIPTLFFAVVSGILLAKFGAYRPLHAAGFAFQAISFGLFTLMNGQTSTVTWTFFQLIASAGGGLVISVLLPAIMATLPESDVAVATAAFSFLKTFGYIWGVTIPSIIFNAAINANLHLISVPDLREQLRDGKAYAFASEAHNIRGSTSDEVWAEITDVYSRSLTPIWWVGLGLSIIGFFCVGLEKAVELRTELVTEYGLDTEEKDIADATEKGIKPT